ncbi:antibiotic biosynthesis monooxygenase [Chloroflexota bacterium]
MIKVIVVRHFLPEKERDAARLLGELRRREVQQDGCITDEILWSVDDPSMWVDISTWIHSDQWKNWESTGEYIEIYYKMLNLLITTEEVIMLKIFK